MDEGWRVASIPIGKHGKLHHYLELDWHLLDLILSYCSVATLTAVRSVCSELRVAVDFLMELHARKDDINLHGMVHCVEHFLDLPEIQTCADKNCRKCKQRKRLHAKHIRSAQAILHNQAPTRARKK